MSPLFQIVCIHTSNIGNILRLPSSSLHTIVHKFNYISKHLQLQIVKLKLCAWTRLEHAFPHGANVCSPPPPPPPNCSKVRGIYLSAATKLCAANAQLWPKGEETSGKYHWQNGLGNLWRLLRIEASCQVAVVPAGSSQNCFVLCYLPHLSHYC